MPLFKWLRSGAKIIAAPFQRSTSQFMPELKDPELKDEDVKDFFMEWERHCWRCGADRPIAPSPSLTGAPATPRLPQDEWTCERCGYLNSARQ